MFAWTPLATQGHAWRVFVALLVGLEVLPQVLVATASTCCQLRVRGRHLPLGKWALVGNPFPHTGVVFYEPYPSRPHAQVQGRVAYTYPTSVVGFALHVGNHISTLFWPPVVTSDRAVRADGHTYFMPTFDRHSDAAFEWMRNIVLVPHANDPRIWYRCVRGREHAPLYAWIHESHPHAPWTDEMYCPTRVSSPYSSRH